MPAQMLLPTVNLSTSSIIARESSVRCGATSASRANHDSSVLRIGPLPPQRIFARCGASALLKTITRRRAGGEWSCRIRDVEGGSGVHAWRYAQNSNIPNTPSRVLCESSPSCQSPCYTRLRATFMRHISDSIISVFKFHVNLIPQRCPCNMQTPLPHYPTLKTPQSTSPHSRQMVWNGFATVSFQFINFTSQRLCE